jgi:hypothetical protein
MLRSVGAMKSVALLDAIEDVIRVGRRRLCAGVTKKLIRLAIVGCQAVASGCQVRKVTSFPKSAVASPFLPKEESRTLSLNSTRDSNRSI